MNTAIRLNENEVLFMPLGVLSLIFVVCIAISIPVGITLMIVSLLPNLVGGTFAATPQLIVRSMIAGVDSFPVIAIPLFVLAGVLMAQGGIAEKIFNVFAYFIGNKTAGIPIVVIATCLFYGAISGSAPATTAAVGSMTIPILVGLNYDKEFSTALVATSGGLGVIIPPSIPFILYGMATGASIGDMFIAGILPGILIGLCLMIYAYYYCKTRGEDKEKLNSLYESLRSKGLKNVLSDSFWALLSPIIILGSIYSGIVSPTEAATIAVIYSLIVSLYFYKTLTYKDLPKVLKESVRTSAPVLIILAAATAFARVLTFMQVPQLVSNAITSRFSSSVSILLIINAILLFVGMIMDTGPAILILAPIFLPIVAACGVHPIHFGIIMVVNLAIGFVTPPVGDNLYIASALTGLDVVTIAKAALPFIAFFFIALLLITFIPEISLLLVSAIN